MAVPRVNQLRLENWQAIQSLEQRRGALQELADGLAAQEGRDGCPVEFIPDAQLKQAEAKGMILRGYYEPTEKKLYINPDLVGKEQPYDATLTLFHESRHAYQHHVVANLDKAENVEQAKDWEWNLKQGYISGDEKGLERVGHAVYRWQPVEKDANEVALERSDELFKGEFNDQSQYSQWREARERKLARDQIDAQTLLGDNYIERAREYALAKNNGQLPQELNEQVSSTRQSGEGFGNNVGEGQSSISESSDSLAKAPVQPEKGMQDEAAHAHEEAQSQPDAQSQAQEDSQSETTAQPTEATKSKDSEQSSENSQTSTPDKTSAKSAEEPAKTPSTPASEPEEDYSYGYGY